MLTAGQATWRHSSRHPRVPFLGLEGERRCPLDLLSLCLRAGLPLLLCPRWLLLPDLSDRDDRDEVEDPEAEDPDAEDPDADELDLELGFDLLDPEGVRGFRVRGAFLAAPFSFAGAATSLGGFAN